MVVSVGCLHCKQQAPRFTAAERDMHNEALACMARERIWSRSGPPFHLTVESIVSRIRKVPHERYWDSLGTSLSLKT